MLLVPFRSAYHSVMAMQGDAGETSKRRNVETAKPRSDEGAWTTAHGSLVFGRRCLVMGVLNVTPDSFSDGGRYATTDAAVRRAREMVDEGADLIDIGGESTRPGATPTPPAVQIERVVPVIHQSRREGVRIPISIDTRSAAAAAAALEAGADIVNDVSAGRHDCDMPRLLRDRGVPFVMMHMQGTPETMQEHPKYGDVVRELLLFFEERAKSLAAEGVDVSRMMIDPGIGFGKTLEHNLAILRSLRELTQPRAAVLHDFGGRWPLLVGPSRKKFLGTILGEENPARRIMGTAAVVAHCALAGAAMVRVHDVREMRQVVEVCAKLQSG